jgi:hypothetical protein
MPAIGQDMWGQYACRAGFLFQLCDQIIGRRAMMVAARIAFIRRNNCADEFFHLGANIQCALRHAHSNLVLILRHNGGAASRSNASAYVEAFCQAALADAGGAVIAFYIAPRLAIGRRKDFLREVGQSWEN